MLSTSLWAVQDSCLVPSGAFSIWPHTWARCGLFSNHYPPATDRLWQKTYTYNLSVSGLNLWWRESITIGTFAGVLMKATKGSVRRIRCVPSPDYMLHTWVHCQISPRCWALWEPSSDPPSKDPSLQIAPKWGGHFLFLLVLLKHKQAFPLAIKYKRMLFFSLYGGDRVNFFLYIIFLNIFLKFL